jgi:hypothetical protein
MKFGKLLTVVVLVAFMAVVVTGCSKVTKSNYDKIENGMSKADVEKILGKGTEEKGGGVGDLTGTMVTWKKGETSISVTFANDKVVAKAQSGL